MIIFQRIMISPASISTLALGHSRPIVVSINDTAHVQQLELDKKQQAKKSGS